MSTIARLRPTSLLVVKDKSLFGQHADTIVGNCQRTGFSGSLIVSTIHELFGNLTETRQVPDMAAVLVETEAAADVCEELCRRAIPAICVVSGGYPSHPRVSEHLRACMNALARTYGTLFIGPSGGGLIDTVSRCAPFAGNVSRNLRAGDVGIAAQGGAIVETFTSSNRVGVSSAISCGTSATFSVTTALEYFADDPYTKAVLAFIEGIDDGPRLMTVAQDLNERGKPLAVLKVGRSPVGKAGVLAHSEEYAGNARVFDAAMAASGAIVCNDLDEFIAVGEILSAPQHPSGPRTHVVAYSGAEANMVADMAHQYGLILPEMSERAVGSLHRRWPHLRVSNPIDPWHIDDATTAYGAALEACASEVGDIVMLVIDQSTSSTAQAVELTSRMIRLLHERVEKTGKLAILLSLVGQDPPDAVGTLCHQLDVTCLRGARAAIAGLAKVVGVNRSSAAVERMTVGEKGGKRRGDRRFASDEHTSLSLLEQHGFHAARRRMATTVADAIDAARAIGYPVVVKGLSAEVTHKQESGLVRLDVTNDREVRGAVDAIRRSRLGGPVMTVLVEEYVHGEVEIFLGAIRDSVFGPALLLGPGGEWVDMSDEVAVSLEAGSSRIANMLNHTVLGHVLRKRHDSAVTTELLIDAADGLLEIMATNDDIISIDVNPLILAEGSLIAADALVVHADGS